jgi:glucokinase
LSIVLADLGGTHLRLAKASDPRKIVKYKIADYPDLESVLKEFAPDIAGLYLAAAIHPRGGIIEDKRFDDKSHWTINLSKLQDKLQLQKLLVLNDLEAAAHALPALIGDDLLTVLAAREEQVHFDHPPKLLVGIGTGIGHAFLFEKAGHEAFVQRSHGGHIPALAVSEEQKDIVAKLCAANTRGRDLIVEDIVSGSGYANLLSLMPEEDALRLFAEFLGLYCNALVSLCGAYGGIYFTGGVIDELMAAQKFDAASFSIFFNRPMVPVVIESLASTPVYYCREANMPIVGLSTLVRP